MDLKYLSDIIDYSTDIEPYSIIEIISGVGSGKNYWVETLAKQGKRILLITSRKITMNQDCHRPLVTSIRLVNNSLTSY